MKYIVFDIETAPQDKERLLSQMPPFDPTEVKVGNIKDPELIKAKVEGAKAKYEQDYIDKAALSALTGQVCAIGYAFEDGTDLRTVSPVEYSEKDLIEDFWILWKNHNDGHGVTTFIGHNIYEFDLPFLVRRSWTLDIKVPHEVFSRRGGRTFWNDLFIDTRTAWTMGSKEGLSNLDVLGRCLVGQGKNGDGALFHTLLNGSTEDFTKAMEYLKNDLKLTQAIALKMGLIQT